MDGFANLVKSIQDSFQDRPWLLLLPLGLVMLVFIPYGTWLSLFDLWENKWRPRWRRADANGPAEP